MKSHHGSVVTEHIKNVGICVSGLVLMDILHFTQHLRKYIKTGLEKAEEAKAKEGVTAERQYDFLYNM